MGEEGASRQPAIPTDSFWDWDVRAGAVVVSAALRFLLGYVPTQTESTLTEWQRGIHPDDLVGTTRTLFDHLSRKAQALPYAIECVPRVETIWRSSQPAPRNATPPGTRFGFAPRSDRSSRRRLLPSTSRAGSLLAGRPPSSRALASAPTDAHALDGGV